MGVTIPAPPQIQYGLTSGTVTTTATSNAVTGVGTHFTLELKVGWTITCWDGVHLETQTITSITDDTHLHTIGNYANSFAAGTPFSFDMGNINAPVSVPFTFGN